MKATFESARDNNVDSSNSSDEEYCQQWQQQPQPQQQPHHDDDNVFDSDDLFDSEHSLPNDSSGSIDSALELITTTTLDPPPAPQEIFRDRILEFLEPKRCNYFVCIVVFGILASGAVFFFMFMGWQTLCRPRTDCELRNQLLNNGIQVLNVCLTAMATYALPWRLTQWLHVTGLSFPHRVPRAGCDLYGRDLALHPHVARNMNSIDYIWYHLCPRQRGILAALLLANVLCQYANQTTRIIYRTYALQDTTPGNVWTSVFFAASFTYGLIAATLFQIWTGSLRRRHPDKFGPHPIVAVSNTVSQRVSNSFRKKLNHSDTAVTDQISV